MSTYELDLDIAGLGIVFYSPFAVAHIAEEEDFLSAHFMNPGDVAQYVNACTISAIGTGTSGEFQIRLYEGAPPSDPDLESAAVIRLGLEVRDTKICFRDLYDLMEWTAVCPEEQTISWPDGFYLITVVSYVPPSGYLGEDQVIEMYFEPVAERPKLVWPGVPDISSLLGG